MPLLQALQHSSKRNDRHNGQAHKCWSKVKTLMAYLNHDPQSVCQDSSGRQEKNAPILKGKTCWSALAQTRWQTTNIDNKDNDIPTTHHNQTAQTKVTQSTKSQTHSRLNPSLLHPLRHTPAQLRQTKGHSDTDIGERPPHQNISWLKQASEHAPDKHFFSFWHFIEEKTKTKNKNCSSSTKTKEEEEEEDEHQDNEGTNKTTTTTTTTTTTMPQNSASTTTWTNDTIEYHRQTQYTVSYILCDTHLHKYDRQKGHRSHRRWWKTTHQQ